MTDSAVLSATGKTQTHSRTQDSIPPAAEVRPGRDVGQGAGEDGITMSPDVMSPSSASVSR